MATKHEMPEDPEKRYEWLEAQKQELVAHYVNKLKAALDEAAKTCQFISTKLGKPDVLKDECLRDALTSLGLGTHPKADKKSGDRKPRLDGSLRKWLSEVGPKTQQEICAQFKNEEAKKIEDLLQKRSAGKKPIFKRTGDNWAALNEA